MIISSFSQCENFYFSKGSKYFFHYCLFHTCVSFFISTALWPFLHLSPINQKVTLTLSRFRLCDFMCAEFFLLVEWALVLPLLFGLSILTFSVNLLFPERLNVHSVMDLSHIHLQKHNTDRQGLKKHPENYDRLPIKCSR